MKNIIPEFIKPEQDYIKENANFTDEELRLFELRNKKYSHEVCAELLPASIATEKRINKKMMVKIMKVIENMDI